MHTASTARQGGNGDARPEHARDRLLENSSSRALAREPLRETISRADLARIFLAYGIKLAQRSAADWCRCPFHQDRTPSCRIDRRRQRFICFACGARGDALDLVAHMEGITFSKAIHRLRQLIGNGSPAVPAPPPRPRSPDELEQEAALKEKALQTALAYCDAHRRTIRPGTPAATYLEIVRHCYLPDPGGDLGWDPQAGHPYCSHVGPALVGLVTHAITGEPLSVHRTWLADDGSGKANLPLPRLIWEGTSKAEGIIRLDPINMDAKVLVVGEGIETGLSVPPRPGRVRAACMDADNLGRLPVINHFAELVILVDHDEPGIRNAKLTEQRWLAAGRSVRQRIPKQPGDDFNDVARRVAR